MVDDQGVLVRNELMPQSPSEPMTVRVHTPVGSAVAVWRGEPHEAVGRHHIEWTVDEDVHWGVNTRRAAVAEPGLREESGRVVLRGRLRLAGDGMPAVLEMGESQLPFDIGSPPPDNGIWVEITVDAHKVELYPYLL